MRSRTSTGRHGPGAKEVSSLLRAFRYAILCCCLLGNTQIWARASEIRFAWLSDTHVGGSTGADDLRRVVADINAMHDLDFVLVSGDISEYGSDSQLHEAKSILDSLSIPYHIIPGNHDTKWSASAGETFRKCWGSDRFVFDEGRCRFIGLHQGPRMKMADGYWAPEDLRWLDSLLAALPDRQSPIFFVTHYPVDSSIANWFEVLNLLRKTNVQAILVGHGHRMGIYSYEGIPGVMNRSTLRGLDSVGAYALCRTTPDSFVVCERQPGHRTFPPWVRLHLGVRQYGPPPASAPRPDFSLNGQDPRISRIWKVETGWTIASTAASEDGVTIVGDGSGRVRALDLKDGRERWRFDTSAPVYSTPEISDGKVVFGSADSNLWCLSVSTGSVIWRARTGASLVASPRITGGRVFVGGSDGTFRCLDLPSGRIEWEYAEVEGFVECKPLVASGKVIFGAWDGHLYALDAVDGRLCWKWHGERPGVLFSPAACWPVASAGRVYVVAPDRAISSIDIQTGATVWRSTAHQVRETIGISQDGDRLYVRTMRDSVIAFSARDSIPRLLWSINLGFGYDINSAMIIEHRGVLYYPTKNGVLYALDAATGSLRWKYRVAVGAVHTISPAGDRSIVATDLGGTVSLIAGP